MSRKIFVQFFVIFVKNPFSCSLVAKRVQTEVQGDFNSRSSGTQQYVEIKFFFGGGEGVLHRTKWNSGHLRAQKCLRRKQWRRERCEDECKTELECGMDSTAACAAIKCCNIHLCHLIHLAPGSHHGYCSASSICQMLFCWLNNSMILNKTWEPTYVFRFHPLKHEFHLIYLLTYSKEHSPSWEANQFSASQISPLYWIRRFITAFTSARQMSLSLAR